VAQQHLSLGPRGGLLTEVARDWIGNGGRAWLELQLRYDLAVAERDHGRRIAAEVPEAA
jgi:plasmid maintenance system antidote protein VapI